MAQMIVFAGPNGSGKSTVVSHFSPVGAYINADEIQKFLGCTPLEAAQNAEKTREYYLQKGEDFTFETVLSTPRNLELMQRGKELGYRIKCIYILTNDPKINIARVQARVARGGHDVPKDKIVSRYVRALTLIPDVISVCDEFYIFDNSFEREQGDSALIAFSNGGVMELIPNALWTQERIEALLQGRYPQEYLDLTK